MYKNNTSDKIENYKSISDPVQRGYIMDLDNSFRAKERLVFRGYDHEVNTMQKVSQQIGIGYRLLDTNV